jgi:perosamine synthetase
MNMRNGRRQFIEKAMGMSAGVLYSLNRPAKARAAVSSAAADKPVLLGGTAVHKEGWPRWPEWRQSWEGSVLDVLRSGKWYRGDGGHVADFESAYAKLIGSKRCLATASGTTSLVVSLHVMDIDAGDEVIVSPWTFIATYNAILISKALPVFADTHPETLTMDPASIESRITDRTRAIMPVHIYGMPCDMDPIVATARKHKLAVIEDACQAWLAEYKGRKCGVLGDLGCFSFQNSKHLPSGEGGAITGDSDQLLDRCSAYHNCGRGTGTFAGKKPYFTQGGNYRMQHIQAVMLSQQLDKLVQETAVRRDNADYLGGMLRQIGGVQPVRLPESSRAVWHLYPFRYDARQFNGLPRDRFVRALNAEGIPCSGGYQEQYFDGLMDEAIASRGFKRLFGEKRLKDYRDSFNELKGNREVCATTVAVTQNMLLAKKGDIEHIAEAVRKIKTHSAELAKLEK